MRFLFSAVVAVLASMPTMNAQVTRAPYADSGECYLQNSKGIVQCYHDNFPSEISGVITSSRVWGSWCNKNEDCECTEFFRNDLCFAHFCPVSTTSSQDSYTGTCTDAKLTVTPTAVLPVITGTLSKSPSTVSFNSLFTATACYNSKFKDIDACSMGAFPSTAVGAVTDGPKSQWYCTGQPCQCSLVSAIVDCWSTHCPEQTWTGLPDYGGNCAEATNEGSPIDATPTPTPGQGQTNTGSITPTPTGGAPAAAATVSTTTTSSAGADFGIAVPAFGGLFGAFIGILALL